MHRLIFVLSFLDIQDCNIAMHGDNQPLGAYASDSHSALTNQTTTVIPDNTSVAPRSFADVVRQSVYALTL